MGLPVHASVEFTVRFSPFDGNGGLAILWFPDGMGTDSSGARRAIMRSERFEYVIDANDLITQVNEAWRAFARENDGAGLGDAVVGSWLWQHFAGIEVKHLYRVLLERVRAGRKPVTIPFRCDAPELRRYMMLEIMPLPDNSVRFSSWVEEAEARPRIYLLEAGRPEDPNEFLRMCAWCKRVGKGEDGWQELEDALTDQEVLMREPLPKITHGVCPECQSMVLRELEGVE